MPPKKKPKKPKKKDPKTISQSVKQSVVIKIGDTPAKKKRTYTKRAPASSVPGMQAPPIVGSTQAEEEEAEEEEELYGELFARVEKQRKEREEKEASLLSQGSTPSQGSFVSDKLTQSEPIPYLTERLVKSDVGSAEEPTKTKTEAQIKAEAKEIRAREIAEEKKAEDDKRATRALEKEEAERAAAIKFNDDVEKAYNLISMNGGSIGRKGAPTKAESVAIFKYKEDQKAKK